MSRWRPPHSNIDECQDYEWKPASFFSQVKIPDILLRTWGYHGGHVRCFALNIFILFFSAERADLFQPDTFCETRLNMAGLRVKLSCVENQSHGV